MALAETIVVALAPAHHEAWLDMWKAYCAFYDVDIPEGVTRRTWERPVAG